MKKIIVFISILFSLESYAQSSFNRVYQLLNSSSCGNNFNSCHNGSGPSGLNFNQTEAQVFAQLFNQAPHNTTATEKGDKLVYPGNPYRSFLFRKINNGLAFNVDLENGEGVYMPQSSPPLDNKQIELIRQWILHGAPFAGDVVNTNLIAEFYDNAGIESMANPPVAPDEHEGLQLHLGPFFLPPGGENLSSAGIPLMIRMDLNVEDTMEIIRIENHAGTGFHHSGVSVVNNTDGIENIPYGVVTQDSLASIVAFSDVKLLAAFQQSLSLTLPSGTAFEIPKDAPFLYSDHFINTSSTKVLSCDVYLNIYYQPKHTALQNIKVQLWNYANTFSNPPILLPPDNQLYEYSENIFQQGSTEKRYIWGIMCHSHVHTVYHDFYLRNSNGTKGQKIYEGACPDGLPGCSTPMFQPFEIPTRYFNNFIELNVGNGLRREAGFRNQTNDTVHAGGLALSNEMLGMAYYYVDDTTGIGAPPSAISEDQLSDITSHVNVYPNPFSQNVVIDWREWQVKTPVSISVFGLTGNLVYNSDRLITNNIRLSKENLGSQGIYFFMLKSGDLNITGKLILQ